MSDFNIKTATHLIHSAFQDSEVGLLLCDATNSPLVYNARASGLWGLKPEIFNDQAWSEKLLACVKELPDGVQRDLFHTDMRRLRIPLNDGRLLEQVRRPISESHPEQGYLWTWSDVTAQAHLDQALQSSSDLLDKLSERVPGIIFKFQMWPDGHACFPYMSQAVNTMYPGVTPQAIRHDATPFFAFRHPEDAAGLQASMLRSAQTMSLWDHEYRLVIPHEGIVWRHGTASPERQADGSIAWHGIILDITERKRIEEALRLTSSVFDTSGEGILVVDAACTAVAVNPSFTRITGYTSTESIGLQAGEATAHPIGDLLSQNILAELEGQGLWSGEIRSRRKNGDAYPLRLRISTVFNKRQEPTHRVVIFEDISERKKADEQIWHQANYDFLTELPNRRLLLDRLKQELSKAERDKSEVALLFIDLDNFKEINDTLGHDIGDQLLLQVAGRLKECVNQGDSVARLGGDEFTVLLVGDQVTLAAERIATAIETTLTQPFAINSERVYTSASIGISHFPDDALNVETMFKHADQALYAAKHNGRGTYSWFTSAMQTAALRRRDVVSHLHAAMPKQQFEVVYQPVINLQTRTITKAEALLRWHCNELPRIGPAEFIPVAEDLGLINEIGEWVFKEAAQLIHKIQNEFGKSIQIAVNKSPRQFGEHLSVNPWHQHLAALGIASDRVIVEITEGLLLDNCHHVREQLNQLRDAGLQVALDDFGTGYSAMSYLLKFQIDILKIDQSFVRNLDTLHGQAIVEAMVAMAHKLGLKVVAEGVESAHENAFLESIQCDFAQGFYFSKPVSGTELESMLSTNHPGALYVQ